MTFSEITERAIKDAFANPRAIDSNLVDAQQARRIVDRLVGYTLSPLLSRKVRSGLSAGRVQSVAVRLVVEREREIDAFVAREYWTLRALLATERDEEFEAELVRIDGQALEVGDGETADRHATALRGLRPRVTSLGNQEAEAQPRATVHDLDAPAGGEPQARLQPEADDVDRAAPVRGRRDARRARRADHLHANRLGGDGRRRDGRGARRDPRALRRAVHDAQGPRLQDQVEGRPGGARVDPPDVVPARPGLAGRVPQAGGAPAVPPDLAARPGQPDGGQGARDDDRGARGRPYELRASATRVLFDGFSRVYTEGRDDRNGTKGDESETADEDADGRLPALNEGEDTDVRDVTTTQHFTEPPPRFTEASLIKALEEHGIGRPSTYAATISTIVDRGYVRIEDRRLQPEQVAGIVIDLLVEHFGDYVDLEFTARMEEELDEVARGERKWVPLLEAFYEPLRLRVDEKRKLLRRRDFTTEPSDEVCSLGHPMVIRLGRNGKFLACSLYPEHKESRPLPGDEAPTLEGTGDPCPECGTGTLVGKRGRFGPFVGCDRYPDCGYIKREGPQPPPPLPFDVVCPKNADGKLVARRARRTGNVFWGCSNYPKCDYTTNHEPIGALHDADEGPVAKKGEAFLCLKCGAAIEVPPAALEDGSVVGMKLPGGPPNPEALAPARRGRGSGGPGGRRSGGGRSGAGGGAGRRRGSRTSRTSSPT